MNSQQTQIAKYKALIKARYQQSAQSLVRHRHKLPAPIAQFIERSPQVALGLILGVVLIVGLSVPGISSLLNLLIGLGAIALVIVFAIKSSEIRPTYRNIFFAVLCVVFPPFIILLLISLLLPRLRSNVKRGAQLQTAPELQRQLSKAQAQIPIESAYFPLLEIGGIKLPNTLENLGFFFVGSPGSGKTQAIKQLLVKMRDRPDFRVMVLDRNGELAEAFYNEKQDLLFNPRDARSLCWTHHAEGMEPETIAGGLVPDDPKDRFFSEAAKSLLSDLYERCQSNAEIWDVISTFSLKDLQDFLHGGVSARFFQSENTGASVLSTLVNEMRFYKKLPDGEGFSFSQWGRTEDPRWIFATIYEDDAELFKPLFSMAFELMLRGLLSHPDPESRRMKTAIVIDELGALNPLRSLARLLSEARKFLGTAVIGTQTEAQIDRNYGEHDRRIILQGTATKLILNCRDTQTAEMMANLIGKQERYDVTRGASGWKSSAQEQIRDVHLVLPTELQSLPKLEGYLTISDGTSPAKVRVQPQSYPKISDRFVPAEMPSRPMPSTPDASTSGNSSGTSHQRTSINEQNRTLDRGR